MSHQNWLRFTPLHRQTNIFLLLIWHGGAPQKICPYSALGFELDVLQNVESIKTAVLRTSPNIIKWNNIIPGKITIKTHSSAHPNIILMGGQGHPLILWCKCSDTPAKHRESRLYCIFRKMYCARLCVCYNIQHDIHPHKTVKKHPNLITFVFWWKIHFEN